MKEKIKELFNLKDVVITPYHPDENRRRKLVAHAAAAYLERYLIDGSVVAVGLGRNTNEIANSYQPARHSEVTFVSAMGGSPYLGKSINPNEICLNFASRAGGKAEILYAPVYLESRLAHDLLVEQPSIQRTMDLARLADIAVIGIGTTSDNSILVQAGCLSIKEAQRLRQAGVVGAILGNHFDEQGQSVHSDLDGRIISLNLAEIGKIPLVIAAVSEMEKSKGVLGALRTKVIRTLIIECNLALEVLRLAGVTDLAVELSP